MRTTTIASPSPRRRHPRLVRGVASAALGLGLLIVGLAVVPPASAEGRLLDVSTRPSVLAYTLDTAHASAPWLVDITDLVDEEIQLTLATTADNSDLVRRSAPTLTIESCSAAWTDAAAPGCPGDVTVLASGLPVTAGTPGTVTLPAQADKSRATYRFTVTFGMVDAESSGTGQIDFAVTATQPEPPTPPGPSPSPAVPVVPGGGGVSGALADTGSRAVWGGIGVGCALLGLVGVTWRRRPEADAWDAAAGGVVGAGTPPGR